MTRGDWFSGPLLSRHFVEQVLPRAFAGRLGEASADGGHRRLRQWLAASRAMLGPASGLRAICDVGAAPLFGCLGYRLRDVAAVGSDPSSLSGMLAGTLEGSHGVTLRLVIVPWQARLDHTWRTVMGAGLQRNPGLERSARLERSAHFERGAHFERSTHFERSIHPGRIGHLGRGSARGRASRAEQVDDVMSEATRWAFCFNGRQLRLVDVDRPYARRFLEFDLRETLDDANRSRLLWALARPAAFAMRTGSRPALVSEIVAACDAHGVGIREALQGGVREALELLCAELARAARRTSRRASPTDAAAADVVSQGLTLLYRVLFLLFAEARALVPVWHPLYRDSYTIATLHRQAERQTPRGLWEGLQAISRLAHAGCETDDLSITAFNSQLFSPDVAPLIDRARIDSAIVARILQSLMTTAGAKGRGRERITYADLGVEQLGAVYERVLDYAPQLEAVTASLLLRRARAAAALKATVETTTAPGAATSSTDRARHHRHADASEPSRDAPRDRAEHIIRGRGARSGETVRRGEPSSATTVPGRNATATDAATMPRTVPLRAGGQRVGARRTGVRRTSVRRKESGTFYTPRGMADYLVRETLAPLTATATADRILSLRVLDPAMGSGAFLVSACRFLAQAYEQALARENRPLPVTGGARAEIRRTIARQCLFGVDLNPMAVQLARLSLWLTTLTTDAPLTFLDHHLRAGDSLVGASLDDLARRRPARPIRIRSINARSIDDDARSINEARSIHTQSMRARSVRDRPMHARARHARSGTTRRGATASPDAPALPLFSGDDTSQLMRSILPSRARLALEDDRPETVHEKERLLASLARDSALASWLTLADLWCASWFWSTPPTSTSTPAVVTRTPAAAGSADGCGPPPTAWAALCDQVLRGSSMLPAHVARAWLDRSREVAKRQRFFHWTLEFPEVFFDASGEPRADGGFDAIIGNPPWDMVRDDAKGDGDVGDEAREPASASRAAVSRFVRESGIYDAIGDAHANSYQLFVDRSLSLLRRDGGRLGLVVPWGLAADHGSARLRRRLLERCDVDTMISFDNRDGLFPIHRGLRFLLVTATTGRATSRIDCRFGERDPAVLDRLVRDRAALPTPPLPSLTAIPTLTPTPTLTPAPMTTRALSIAPALLRRVSGEGLAFPDIRSRECLSLLERMHATWPALTSADGWNVTFGRELHASDDRGRLAGQESPGLWSANEWPAIEGKHLHPFHVRVDEARFVVAPEHREAVLARVPGLTRHRLAYRDVSSSTNRLTLIAAIVPPHVVTTHTLFCLRSPLALDVQHGLCGMMNSFVANYFVRLRVSTHVTLASLDYLPMPPPGPWMHELSALAEGLSKPIESPSMPAASAPPPAPAPAARSRAAMSRHVDGNVQAVTTTSVAAARLQALAGRAYGLTLDEFRHILATFPLVSRQEKEAALEAFVSLG